MTEQTVKLAYHRKGHYRATYIAIVALIIFVALVYGFDALVKPAFSGVGLVVIGIVLCLIPAALWLFVFYQQDRAEPEPVGYVGRMFVIGLALAGAIGIPLSDQVFHLGDWLYRDNLTMVIGRIFVTGAIEAFIVYATVRYFMFDNPEFDERADGVVYGTAAALGYATAINIQFILGSGGAALGVGEINIVAVVFAQAAFGGILGYFLGRAKLEKESVIWLAFGFLITTVLNGLFYVLQSSLITTLTKDFTQKAGILPAFVGLILSGVLTLIVTIIILVLINRDVARTLAGKQKPVDPEAAVGDRAANYLVVTLFIACLIVGAVFGINANNQVKAFDYNGVKGVYPAYFSLSSTPDQFSATDLLISHSEFNIEAIPLNGQKLQSTYAVLAADRAGKYQAYKVLESKTDTVNGKEALVQRFVYVNTSEMTKNYPRIVEGIDYIVQSGEKAIVVTLLSPPEKIGEMETSFHRFLNSLTF